MSDGTAADRIKERRRNAVDPEEFLLEVGAVQPTDGGEDLRFASGFVDRVERQLDQVAADGVTPADLAAIFGTDDEDVTDADRPYPAFKINSTVRSWPSDGAVQLDVAVDRELREETEQWTDVPPRQRYRILQSLRSFQDECLFCSGRISISDETVESCCSDVEVVTIECADCERRFLEFSPDSIPGQ